MPTRLLSPIAVAAALLLAAPAQAQKGPSMEERLRAELRNTMAQLQQAQNQLAERKAPAPAAGPSQGELAGLKKELARSQAQLAQERKGRGQQDEERQRAQAAAQEAAAQIAQYRAAQEGALKQARTAEAERQRLDADAVARRDVVARCEAQNARLYAAGQDILRAYESLDLLSVARARQPFAAQSRVRLEQIAQQYGDRLYEGRFDARAGAPAAQPAAQ